MNAPSTSTSLANPFDRWFQPLPVLKGSSLIDHLFNRLDGSYPHKWRSNFPNQQAIDNWSVSWAEAFEEEGITPDMIRGGLKACRTKYDWPPSLPEFIKACKPSVDAVVAFHEAQTGLHARENGEVGVWSHPAVYWAAIKIGAFDFKHQTYSVLKTRWEKALADEMAKGEWAAIPIPLVALPAPGKTELSREEADKRIKELQATEVVKKATTPADHLMWAKRIIERNKRGDKSLSAIQLRFAREAMTA